MKKIFKLTDEKKHKDRLVEAIKHDVRKYIKRERKKKLPNAETMYWAFDCKIGTSATDSHTIEIEALIKAIDSISNTDTNECYIEILAKAVEKPIKEESPSIIMPEAPPES